MKVRRFLIYCVLQSPPLVPEFFRVISIPDPGKHFPFMSTLRFLGVLIHQGPSPCDCFFGNRELTANAETSTTDLLAAIWPLKLKRQAVSSEQQTVVRDSLDYMSLRTRSLLATVVASRGGNQYATTVLLLY
jgi:hypothetical protein